MDGDAVVQAREGWRGATLRFHNRQASNGEEHAAMESNTDRQPDQQTADEAVDETLDQGGPMVLPCPVVTCPTSCRRGDEA